MRSLLLPLLLLPFAGCSPKPRATLIDHQAVFRRYDWWDNRDWPWYEANIPFFESPDPALDETYYYRWELVTKHLTYGSPATGYVFTEFIDRPFWSGAYGSISCPLGHQLDEARWLRDPRPAEDFARYWFETPGAQPRRYSNWYGAAVWGAYAVIGDTAFLHAMLPHMEAQVAGWTAEHWDPVHRMYHWVGAWDGMETNINSRLTDDTFSGADGYRPTLNSYLWADMRAIARTAALFGEADTAAAYARRAADLEDRVQKELWDPKRSFFFHQFAHDEIHGIRKNTLTYQSGPYAGNPHGRELIGYIPWEFSLPDSGYAGAWRFLMDTAYFAAPFGPTTVERHDPQFWISPRCCVWSGNEWPYATTQTLVAMANLLDDYHQTVVTKNDYYRLLHTYALDQRMNGRPYVAEAANPLTGSWSGHNTFYHSEHYFHSGFVDLVVSGLVGLRPRGDDTLEVAPLAPDSWPYFALENVRYHGHDVAVAWDRDGSRYHRGAGLAVWVDGREVARVPTLERVKVALPPAPPQPPEPRLSDWAVNNEAAYFPFASASSSDPRYPPFYAVDGNRWYHPSPPDRWVAAPSKSGTDWLQVDFGAPRPVQRVQLYFLDDVDGPKVEATGDEARSGVPGKPGATDLPVRPPASYEVQRWNGTAWSDVPGQRRTPATPMGRRANTVDFPLVRTSRIRVVLHHRSGATSGMTEIETWGPADAKVAPPTEAVGDLAL
ncbi:MAG: discoidin domain-containing protein, partial [Gemmatimonadetes bacterium]|nr:discoidin domain-containing protein [Gemmatimonadota bacterium]